MPEIECCCTIYLYIFFFVVFFFWRYDKYNIHFFFSTEAKSFSKPNTKGNNSLEDTFTPSGRQTTKSSHFLYFFSLPLTIHNLKHLCLLGNSFAQFILRNNLLFKSIFSFFQIFFLLLSLAFCTKYKIILIALNERLRGRVVFYKKKKKYQNH